MLNAVTIDLEDWYQGIEQPIDTWERFTDRLHVGTDVLLEILDQTNTKATFFVLGWVAEKYPSLIRRISEQGHEIASHGYDDAVGELILSRVGVSFLWRRKALRPYGSSPILIRQQHLRSRQTV